MIIIVFTCIIFGTALFLSGFGNLFSFTGALCGLTLNNLIPMIIYWMFAKN